jgi:hypothetical protein
MNPYRWVTFQKQETAILSKIGEVYTFIRNVN